jgi:hypothetical protein
VWAKITRAPMGTYLGHYGIIHAYTVVLSSQMLLLVVVIAAASDLIYTIVGGRNDSDSVAQFQYVTPVVIIVTMVSWMVGSFGGLGSLIFTTAKVKKIWDQLIKPPIFLRTANCITGKVYFSSWLTCTHVQCTCTCIYSITCRSCVCW